ncbi:type II secretion system F family protein [Tepidibacillus sp. HK-1]|uniref:type II secretion system F family protein n=1 Tax=Tepidibacillus sp. HK-1 TaxID=1883407 RepID=UPI0008532554|nr:type II secretion system F family protein [Tepidibacillus sp. HK-1]GBF10525.1 bacterial type II secretion system protein F domain protein [Tepidibacillus sp. HK-1]
MSQQMILLIVGGTVAFITFTILKLMFNHRLKVAKRIMNIVEDRMQKSEEDPYSLPFQERMVKPLLQKMGKSVIKWTPYSLKKREHQLLNLAGYPHHLTLQEWMTWRSLFWLGLGGVFTMVGLSQEAGMNQLLFPLVGWILGYLLPIFYLNRKKEERKEAIVRGLPEVLDILTVSVEAGLGFDAALSKVVEKTRGILSDELYKTLQEIKMGKGRREALKALGERTGVEDMIQFVGSIIQADQLGIRIGNVLRVQSEDMRQKRKQRAEEKAMKAPIKILFPLVLFIFPAIFIIILGPAVINIMNTLLK